ncbi:TOMM precursor leader peptide-binding protein [Mesorhizobium calcicola]|uniref:TOMM leader peptide-binding protein n=1 Tax=Mesorhizobium calcicola TaxID=1300310 RepID=A0ABW4WDF9_9HYPH
MPTRPDRYKLVPSACIECTSDGAILHSTFGDLLLPGKDASRFVESILPFLDGVAEWRDAEEAIGAGNASNLQGLLGLLERHGIVEPLGQDNGPCAQQRRFLAFCDEAGAEGKLRRARVLVVGSEPWVTNAVTELATSGIGGIHFLDDEANAPQRELSRRLAAAAPSCKVSAGAELAGDGWDLVLGGLSPFAIARQRELARFIAARKLTALFASLQGSEAVLGPAVVDGRPPCWDCCRHRLLANVPEPWTVHRIHRRAQIGSGFDGQRAALAPMNGLIGHAAALWAIQLLGFSRRDELSRQLVVQNLLTLSTTRHQVVPLPWCELCGGAAHANVPSVDWDGLASAENGGQARDLAQGWVDSRTGILPALRARERTVARGSLPYTAHGTLAAYSDAKATTGFSRPYDGPLEAIGGKGMTRGEALVGALAEGLERYSATRVRDDIVTVAHIDGLVGERLDPRRMALYEDQQYDSVGFPFVRFAPERPHQWIAARWADTGEHVWAPARLAFYSEIDDRFAQVTSSGLAAGRDFEDAGRRALFELVERDAFMVTWLCRLPAARLVLGNECDPDTSEVVRGLEALGAEVRFHLLDVGSGIPVVLSLAFGDGQEWPGVTVALGAHQSVRRALRAAALEQGFSGPYIRETMQSGSQRIPDEPAQVTSFLDHALYYVPRHRAAALGFLDVGAPPPVCLADMPDEGNEVTLVDCAAALRGRGIRVALADVTAPDVATSGLHVVRALAEGAQPLHCGYGRERAANPRLERFRTGALNRDVHPMC